MGKWEKSLPPRHRIGLLCNLNVKAVLIGHLRRLLATLLFVHFTKFCGRWVPGAIGFAGSEGAGGRAVREAMTVFWENGESECRR